ncbi:ParM/StbA family protein [Dendronalium sp. ChiSLP03b]|uniref:ParM/StbA family protein n=1 Tax=Dendronalium sp. ChiSLP03b TaxID=3075381 RepID=UPI002AD2FE35|nr:ParM/StbA family protein [Dendronalium sp. ChiSLP03b]MDZ8203510.1 ParM/StbA family protein [Dendronalium sp. ChiSLP03b]
MRRKREIKEYTKVVATIDLGTSSLKGIAQVYPDGVPIVIKMEPEIADVEAGSIEYLSNQFMQDSTVWVGIGEEYFVLGALARSMFAGTSALRDLKYQYALPKVIGMLWLATRRLGVKNPNLEMYVHLLLPVGESNGGEALKIKLAEVLKTGIATPTVKLKAKLRSFGLSAEGAGVMSYRSRNTNVNYFHKNIGMLMLGYRNASFILSHKGNTTKFDTTDLGMNWVVDQFVERTAVGLSKDDSRLISALVEANKNNFDELRHISRKSKPEDVRLDVELFKKTLPVVRTEYVRALLRWLRNIAQMDEILVCGGTASFIRNELTQHFEQQGIPISWNGGMELPKNLNTMELGDRVADVWASHITHIKMLDLNLNYDRKGKPLVPESYTQPMNSSTPETEIWQKNGYLVNQVIGSKKL